MQIYWGFWSVLQVGSNIAILGVMVQFWIVLGDIETPSWAVALGTPVLVFAAIGFGVRHVFKETIGRIRGKRENDGDEEMGRGREVDEDGDVGGTSDEVDSDKYNKDRSLSTASVYPFRVCYRHLLILRRPTMVQTEAPPSRNSIESYRRPSNGDASPNRHTFWQRDLRFMLNEVVSDRSREHGRT